MAFGQQVIQLHAQDGGLASCMSIARVATELTDYITKELKMSNLNDFYFYVSKENWETELDTKILEGAVAVAKAIKEEERPLQLSRLRMAWQSASKVLATAEAVSTPTGATDDPLPESVRQMLDQRWKVRYPEMPLEPALTASSSIVHRLYREWVQNQQATVMNLSRMKTALAERFVGEKLQLSLGGATLTLSEASSSQASIAFRNVAHFYLIHRCLTNAWRYVGNFETTSSQDPSKKVALSYSDFVMRKAVEAPDQLALAWIIKNDSTTRGRMVHYQLQGLTPGEALAKAIADTVEWSIVPSPTGQVQGPSNTPLEEVDRLGSKRQGGRVPAEPASKRPALAPTVTTLKGNKILCKAFNDDRCCNKAPAGSQCDAGWHLCDRKLGSGKGCGGKHRRIDCNLNHLLVARDNCEGSSTDSHRSRFFWIGARDDFSCVQWPEGISAVSS